MRLGDYVLLIAMTLNVSMACLYAYERHWVQALYWLSAFGLNLSLLHMK